jgi:hypothetical protein
MLDAWHERPSEALLNRILRVIESLMDQGNVEGAVRAAQMVSVQTGAAVSLRFGGGTLSAVHEGCLPCIFINGNGTRH